MTCSRLRYVHSSLPIAPVNETIFSNRENFSKSRRGICTYQANASNMLNTGRLQTVALGCLINRSSPFDLSFSKAIRENLLENPYNLKRTLGMLKPAQIKHCTRRKCRYQMTSRILLYQQLQTGLRTFINVLLPQKCHCTFLGALICAFGSNQPVLDQVLTIPFNTV